MSALSDAEREYLDILREDPIRHTREFVGDSRVSGLRREGLESAIEASNAAQEFGEHVKLKTDTPLLRDMDVRWSSVCLMVDRFLELTPVSTARRTIGHS